MPINIYSEEDYRDSINLGESLIGKIDSFDVKILALSLKFGAYLWSEDKHFDKIKDERIKLKFLKTRDLI